MRLELGSTVKSNNSGNFYERDERVYRCLIRSFTTLAFIPLILVAFVAGEAAAQSPEAAQGEEAGLPDQVGPVVVNGSAAAGSAAAVRSAKGGVAVTTHHYDNLRTGWNNSETTLTAANFPADFGLLSAVTLDDQVDAQPLVVPHQSLVINGARSTHDAVYVVTESNSVYAIDASTGAILLSRNLGSPVPWPLGCTNNGPNVGINGTPVIDLTRGTLYVIAYVNLSGDPENPNPAYQLHALNLSTLADKARSPVTIAASHALTDGSTYSFNATYQRQRPGLLELAGKVYAGFGSFCTYAADRSRGWLLGWNAMTLAPLWTNQLNDTQATDPGVNPPFFLSSIWMSGFGIAGQGTDLYFATGNSDCNYFVSPEQCPATSTYDGKTNIQESVVKLKGTLTGIDGIFNPGNTLQLDKYDLDLGSGGVLLLPAQSGKLLAVAAGKTGDLYLLDTKNLSTPLDTQAIEGCWCGPSYFKGPDGISRIISSHGGGGRGNLHIWQVQLSPSPHLVLEASATIASGGLFPGFFTSVSSNGTKAGSAIIWAVGRPVDPNTNYVNLYAFPATAADGTLNQLFSSPAGSWPNTGGNPNIVPVVANGKVYVASAFLDDQGNTRGQLAIFGAGSTGASLTAAPAQNALHPSPVAPVGSSPHAISGTLQALSGSTLTLTTRTGKSVTVDASQAIRNRRVKGPLSVGDSLSVQGSSITATGALVATSIGQAKGSSSEGFWPPDR